MAQNVASDDETFQTKFWTDQTIVGATVTFLVGKKRI